MRYVASGVVGSIALLAATAAVGGCGNRTLETGYVYTPLGASKNERRAFYAGPFSPEAAAAQNEAQAELQNRRPAHGNGTGN